MATVRCKFKMHSVTQHQWGDGKVVWDAEFSAVYGDKPDSENRAFWDATPSGTLKLTTIKQMPWVIGEEYYLDITPAKEG